MAQILYTRASDGCHPVHYTSDPENPTFKLHLPGDKIETYSSARQLLIAVTGHPEARHWTMDRYFKLGRYAPPDRSQGSPILDALGPGGWALGNQLVTSGGVVILKNKEPPLGIDLAARGHEVAKLLYAGFHGLMRSAGYDPQDVLQEVYKGILVRNRGKCPFDPRKSSFGHYVHMVCHCVLSNYHRRIQRYREPLCDSLPGGSSSEPLSFGEGEDKSPAVADKAIDPEVHILQEAVLSSPYHPQRQVAVRMIPYLLRYSKEDNIFDTATIADHLGVSKAVTAKALTLIRHSLRRASRN